MFARPTQTCPVRCERAISLGGRAHGRRTLVETWSGPVTGDGNSIGGGQVFLVVRVFHCYRASLLLSTRVRNAAHEMVEKAVAMIARSQTFCAKWTCKIDTMTAARSIAQDTAVAATVHQG